MAQLGRTNLGGVQLSAATPNVRTFDTSLQKGIPVRWIIQRFSFSLVSTGLGFNLAVDTGAKSAAEGVDDLDTLFNVLFTQWYYEWSAGKAVGSALSPANWRTIFGAINRRDYGGTFKDGAAVPAVGFPASPFYVDVLFPASMDSMFHGGAITTQGSDSMRSASWQYTTGATLTPSVILLGGTAVVSGLTITHIAVAGYGTGGDVGPTWQIVKRALGTLPYDLPDADRLALIDTTPGASYSGSNITFMDLINSSPDDFTTQYQKDLIGVAGAVFDLSSRGLPYFVINPDEGLEGLAVRFGKPARLEIVGLTSTTVYDLTIDPPSASQVGVVGQGMGSVATSRVHPAGLATPLPAILAHLAPVRVQPAALGGPAAISHVSGGDAAAKLVQANVQTAGIRAGLASLFGRG